MTPGQGLLAALAWLAILATACYLLYAGTNGVTP